MANVKISELNELTEKALDDYVPIVDTSTDETKKISIENLVPTEIPNIENTYSESTSNAYSCDYINDSDSYSTTEVKTNKRWIDGKPIYRKVITGTFTGSGTESKSLGISIKIYPIKIEGMIKNNASVVEDTSIPTLFVRGTSNQTIEYRGSVPGPYTIIIEYTKSTD